MYTRFQLRARRALILYKVYGDSTLLVLNETLLNSINALLALNQPIGIVIMLFKDVLFC